MNIYRTPVSGVFRRKVFGFATCGKKGASVSRFVAGIGPRRIEDRMALAAGDDSTRDLAAPASEVRRRDNVRAPARLAGRHIRIVATESGFGHRDLR